MTSRANAARGRVRAQPLAARDGTDTYNPAVNGPMTRATRAAGHRAARKRDAGRAPRLAAPTMAPGVVARADVAPTAEAARARVLVRPQPSYPTTTVGTIYDASAADSRNSYDVTSTVASDINAAVNTYLATGSPVDPAGDSPAPLAASWTESGPAIHGSKSRTSTVTGAQGR